MTVDDVRVATVAAGIPCDQEATSTDGTHYFYWFRPPARHHIAVYPDAGVLVIDAQIIGESVREFSDVARATKQLARHLAAETCPGGCTRTGPFMCGIGEVLFCGRSPCFEHLG